MSDVEPVRKIEPPEPDVQLHPAIHGQKCTLWQSVVLDFERCRPGDDVVGAEIRPELKRCTLRSPPSCSQAPALRAIFRTYNR